jgi:hypothetical protein
MPIQLDYRYVRSTFSNNRKSGASAAARSTAIVNREGIVKNNADQDIRTYWYKYRYQVPRPLVTVTGY